jgi:membrane protease YdiL (CAAX protease family)
MQAVLLVVGAIACLLAAAIAGTSAQLDPVLLLGVGELGLAVVPIAYALRRRDAAVVGVRPASGRFVVAAVLVGSSLWYLNSLVVDRFVAPDPELERLINDSPLPLLLGCAAVLPPIAEELVFRGLLARTLANRLPAAAAIVLSSAAFSLYHWNAAQAFPTFTLGLALGYITLRADSIVPSMIAHALNNTIAIVLPRVAPSLETPVIATAAVALALTAGGLVLATKGAA